MYDLINDKLEDQHAGTNELNLITNLIFACTDFRAHKMVLRAQRFCVHKKVTVGANLHCLILNVLIGIAFPIYFAISQL